jgi:nucleoside-diphosphate-sugar epimerase
MTTMHEVIAFLKRRPGMTAEAFRDHYENRHVPLRRPFAQCRQVSGDLKGYPVNALIIGATGYVGSHVARALQTDGHDVTGLARNESAARKLAGMGMKAATGTLEDMAALAPIAAGFDIVVMAAMIPFELELDTMSKLVRACQEGAVKHFIFTSGTGVLSIEAKDGAWSQYTFAEDDPFPFPALHNRAVRIQTEELIRDAASDTLATYVIRPPLIFGNAGSIQIPQIFESTRRTGAACYLGHGLNLYSAVHVEDLAALYGLVIRKGKAGGLYHAVCGEANFRSIAEAVATVVGCGTRSLDYQAACDLWGSGWVDLGLAVNSRSIARRTVEELDWTTRYVDVIEDIRSGSYRANYEAQLKSGARTYEWGGHGN